MQNLTPRYQPALTPTSQEGGNMVQPDLSKAAMTAPGSDPVSPLPGPTEGSDPKIDPTENVPVSNAPNKPHPRPGRDNVGRWADIDQQPSAIWKKLP